MRDDRVRLSKMMSHALRHAPGEYGLSPDAGGWVFVDDLLAALAHRRPAWAGLRESDLVRLNEEAEKRRFEISEGRIRASYGHSIAQPITHPPATPPPVLFHGTSARFLARIMQEGLRPMRRQFVHLSADVATASRVGRRKGSRTVILEVDTQGASNGGVRFYLGSDGVWLSDSIPPRYLRQM